MMDLTGSARDGSVLVALLGLAFLLVGIIFWIDTLAPAAESPWHLLYLLVSHTFFGVVILALGMHLEQSELPASERRAVLVWCYGGFVLMFALSVWGHVDAILTGTLTADFVSDFVVFTSIGGAFGAIAGANWGRARTNENLAERNQEQRETLSLLTRLVSHDIRNEMMILQGHADLLSDHVGEGGDEYLGVIETRTEKTIRLLEDVRTLVRTLEDTPEFEAIDASQVLRLEVAHFREEFPRVAVTTDIESDLHVYANNLLHHQFSNLLQNAAFHNQIDSLEVFVAAARSGDSIEIEISDNGSGIPSDLHESCFELGEQGPESSGDGIGLYLVAKLAELYGGEIEVSTGPAGGAQFTITLPALDTT